MSALAANEYSSVAKINMAITQGQACGGVKKSIIKALQTVEREHYFMPSQADIAYAEHRLILPGGRVTPSPYEIAKLYDYADLYEGQRVAVISGATGYGAAIASKIAAEVTLFEADESLANAASAIVSGTKSFKVVHAPDVPNDLSNLQSHNKFDRIIIECALLSLPQNITNLLIDESSFLIFVKRPSSTEPGEVLCVSKDPQNHLSVINIGNLNLPMGQ